jgi:hypothetical protein
MYQVSRKSRRQLASLSGPDAFDSALEKFLNALGEVVSVSLDAESVIVVHKAKAKDEPKK